MIIKTKSKATTPSPRLSGVLGAMLLGLILAAFGVEAIVAFLFGHGLLLLPSQIRVTAKAGCQQARQASRVRNFVVFMVWMFMEFEKQNATILARMLFMSREWLWAISGQRVL